MTITKDDRIYHVTENKTTWSVKTANAKLEVTYSVSKNICKCMQELEKYILDNGMF